MKGIPKKLIIPTGRHCKLGNETCSFLLEIFSPDSGYSYTCLLKLLTLKTVPRNIPTSHHVRSQEWTAEKTGECVKVTSTYKVEYTRTVTKERRAT